MTTTFYLRHKASGTFVNACDTRGAAPSSHHLADQDAYEWVPENQLTLQQMRDYERDVYPGHGS